jgi:hypothetical protein
MDLTPRPLNIPGPRAEHLFQELLGQIPIEFLLIVIGVFSLLILLNVVRYGRYLVLHRRRLSLEREIMGLRAAPSTGASSAYTSAGAVCAFCAEPMDQGAKACEHCGRPALHSFPAFVSSQLEKARRSAATAA